MSAVTRPYGAPVRRGDPSVNTVTPESIKAVQAEIARSVRLHELVREVEDGLGPTLRRLVDGVWLGLMARGREADARMLTAGMRS